MVTLPIALVFTVWLSRVVERYQSLGVRLDVQGGGSYLLQPIMEYEWFLLERRMQLSLGSSGSDSELASVDLQLPRLEKSRLNARLPDSGSEYVEGKMVYPWGEAKKVSLRYRGDLMHHWALGKKSWRVKTKKKRLWNGIRKFNLIVPETPALLEEHLGYQVARDLGLLAPVSELVNVRLNGSNRGLYTLVGQVDEQMLRANKRMPGDIFVGDLGFGDMFPRYGNRIFDLPGVWTKAAINNHYSDEHAAAMHRLCQVLDWAQGPEKERALGEILDLEVFARFAAYRSLVQTGHVDHYHNWKLYYDPWRNKFEPIVWDPNAWSETWAPTADYPAFEWPLFSELDRVLVCDQRYRWAFHKTLFEYFQSDHVGETLAELKASGEKVLRAAENDPALSHTIWPSNAQKMNAAQGALRERVEANFETFRSRHVQGFAQAIRSQPRPVADGQWAMEVTVDGWQPVAAVRLVFSEPLPQDYLFFWSVDSKQVHPPTIVSGQEVTLDQPLLPGVQVGASSERHNFTHISTPRPLTYHLRLVLPGRATLGLEEVLQVDLGQRSQPIQVGPVAPGGKVGEGVAALFQGLPAPVQVWHGDRRLQGLTEVHGDLTLAAGATLAMEEGASVIVHGRLRALGTAEEPIRIGPARKGQKPWGTFAIRTSAADSSVLQHVQFTGGSGYKDDLQEYSAMFSAHDADGLRLEHCRFERSQVVDDMVHVVYGQDLQISDCTFDRSLMDALDLDGCSGRIVRSTFHRSGNDAIDLMMSQIEVLDCVLTQSADKGISVGEGSELLCSGGRVEGCGIGVQVKDGSLAWIRGVTFDANRQALHAYKKNWQYGDGGAGLVEECEFRRNLGFASADKHSSWSFANCKMPDLEEESDPLHVFENFSEDLPPSLRAAFESATLLRTVLHP
ncbi:MAG: CotH kinase family protein [Planctomycetes bacterium]|nr:CotH kinase family protein [Planctomycetota bacterium]